MSVCCRALERCQEVGYGVLMTPPGPLVLHVVRLCVGLDRWALKALALPVVCPLAPGLALSLQISVSASSIDSGPLPPAPRTCRFHASAGSAYLPPPRPGVTGPSKLLGFWYVQPGVASRARAA